LRWEVVSVYALARISNKSMAKIIGGALPTWGVAFLILRRWALRRWREAEAVTKAVTAMGSTNDPLLRTRPCSSGPNHWPLGPAKSRPHQSLKFRQASLTPADFRRVDPIARYACQAGGRSLAGIYNAAAGEAVTRVDQLNDQNARG
jgi:hypothetical protein